MIMLEVRGRHIAVLHYRQPRSPEGLQHPRTLLQRSEVDQFRPVITFLAGRGNSLVFLSTLLHNFNFSSSTFSYFIPNAVAIASLR